MAEMIFSRFTGKGKSMLTSAMTKSTSSKSSDSSRTSSDVHRQTGSVRPGYVMTASKGREPTIMRVVPRADGVVELHRPFIT